MSADGLTERERIWRGRIERQRRSGLTVEGFCQQEGVSTASFYQWRKRLGQPAAGARPAGTNRLFVPVTVTGQLGGGIRVELPNAATIHLPEHIDVGRLAEVIQAAGRVGGGGKEERGC